MLSDVTGWWSVMSHWVGWWVTGEEEEAGGEVWHGEVILCRTPRSAAQDRYTLTLTGVGQMHDVTDHVLAMKDIFIHKLLMNYLRMTSLCSIHRDSAVTCLQ